MIDARPRDTVRPDLDAAIATIAAGAAERDRDPSGAFPADAVDTLAAAGAMQVTAGPNPVSYADELALLRSVAAADTGVARILDGHLNAVERLRVHAPPELRDAELAAIATGSRRAGVWGADPVPGEGEPARVSRRTRCTGRRPSARAPAAWSGRSSSRGPTARTPPSPPGSTSRRSRRSRSTACGSAARGCARRPAIA